MLKKIMELGNRYIQVQNEKKDSFLNRMIDASRDEQKSTGQIRKAYNILYGVLAAVVLNQILSLWNLRSTYIFGAPFLCMICIFASVAAFAYSTNFEYYNFWKRKKKNIVVIILYMALTAAAVMSMVFVQLILPVIFLIPINRDITPGMVVWLSRVLYAISISIPSAYIIHELVKALDQPETWAEIDAFKIRKYIDFRKDVEFLYDLKIIKKMEDGKHYVIKQKDRQRHMILNGVTGTAKTSAALVPAVTSDLDQKAYNEDYVKIELAKRIKEKGDIALAEDLTGKTFRMDAFHPRTEEAKEFMEELLKKAPSAGLTVLAPNADFADAVYELATIRGFKVNRVDPIPIDMNTGEMKPGYVGFNPLYISPSLSPYQKSLEIFRKARMFSDVLQSLYEQSGKADPYFTSLNRNLTTTISILVLITYPWLYNGKQPDMSAVQGVINDFSTVRKYLFALAKIVGVGNDIQSEAEVTSDWLARKKFGEYQFIVSQLSYDLLGKGRDKMEDQVRGLRIIINEFLTEPLVRNVLCSEHTVDLDRILERGEITVVNYALELGMSIATGFGQFFCLSFNQAVLRRPGSEKTRLPHFYYADELPVLLHKDMEPIFTLFRQFQTCFTGAFQTSSQFERNDTTRYLKNIVIANCGHHIIYGNCSKEDMELYEALAGKELKFIEQETVSETALSSPNTSISFSTRVTPSMENLIDGYKIRNKDFQEVTVFGINNGDHVKPFDGKLSFLTQEQRNGKGRCDIIWSDFVAEDMPEEVKMEKRVTQITHEKPVDVGSMLEKTGLSYLAQGSGKKDTSGESGDRVGGSVKAPVGTPAAGTPAAGTEGAADPNVTGEAVPEGQDEKDKRNERKEQGVRGMEGTDNEQGGLDKDEEQKGTEGSDGQPENPASSCIPLQDGDSLFGLINPGDEVWG